MTEKSLSLNSQSLDKLTHPELVTLACFSLGGLKKKIHTEEIAIKAHKLSQDNFSWRLDKYTKYADMAKVRKGIDRARKEYWLVGSYSYNVLQDGWKVTDKGSLAVEKYLELIKIKKVNYLLTANDKKILSRLKKNDFFKKYVKDPDNFKSNIYDLADFLNSSSDPNHLRDKFYSISTLVTLSENFELKNLFLELEKKFPKILNKNEHAKSSMIMSKKEKIDL